MTWQLDIQLSLGHFTLHLALSGHAGITGLIGPNGSGKSTLLRTIAGAYHPNSGFIRVDDQFFVDTQQQIALPPEDRRIAYVPQGYGLFPHLRVIDNVSFGLLSRHSKISRTQREQEALRILEQWECLPLAYRYPASLSGGEQQRVALARSLMLHPQLLLLDEPLAALDIPARRKVRHDLAEHLKIHGIPVLLATHDVRDVLSLCTHVYAIEQGTVVQSGSPQDLANQPASDFIAEFFAG